MPESANTMTLKAFVTLLVGAVLAGTAYAQSEDVPPNAVEEQSFSARQVADPPSKDVHGYSIQQSRMPLEFPADNPDGAEVQHFHRRGTGRGADAEAEWSMRRPARPGLSSPSM